MWSQISTKLAKVYSQTGTQDVVDQLQLLIQDFHQQLDPEQKKVLTHSQNLTAADIALITYANSISDPNSQAPTLKTLKQFLTKHDIPDVINTLHLLPFYPWDTDRGFSIEDYYQVEADYGDWSNVKALAKDMRIMVDFVANHASINNPLIQSALIVRHLDPSDPQYQKHAPYQDFVIAFDESSKPSGKELKLLARPRPNPVLTPYVVYQDQRHSKAILGRPEDLSQDFVVLGTGWVWTTFSRPLNQDGTEATRQVDLNFKNPQVFVETIKILLFYLQNHSSLIRLDAIGYIWKKLGQSSLHEPECHFILEIIHDVLQVAAPGAVTIAEVNEPQDKVLPYLGTKDRQEADLVYQFTHFPLAVYAVLTGDAKPYGKWLSTLQDVGGRQFTTVLGSHDGIGLKPARGFLTDQELDHLVETWITHHQALPNYAHLPGGQQIVYEVCATPWNLINRPHTTEDFDLQLDRYLAVLALGLSIRGIPGLYINGLLGSPNYYPKEGLDENRTINRQIFDINNLSQNLHTSHSQMAAVLDGVKQLLKIRQSEPLFAPDAPVPQPIDTDYDFIIATHTSKAKTSLINLTNVSNHTQTITLDTKKLDVATNSLTDPISDTQINLESGKLEHTLKPYQFLWLKS